MSGYSTRYRIPAQDYRVPTEDELKEYYIPYSFYMASTFTRKLRGSDPPSAALEALGHAIKDYNPYRGAHFDTLYGLYLRRYLIDDCRRNKGSHDVSLEEMVSSKQSILDTLANDSAQKSLDDIETLCTVPRLIESLPEDERMAIVFRYFADFTVEEVAIAMCWGCNKASRVLAKAHRRMHEMMKFPEE